MSSINKLIDYIKAESEAKCTEIARNTQEECGRIRAEYQRLEQDGYWKVVNAGSKETETRHNSLIELATNEANRQIISAQMEILDEAFKLAAEKIRELPDDEYKALLSRHGKDNAEDLIAAYKEELTPEVTSALYE